MYFLLCFLLIGFTLINFLTLAGAYLKTASIVGGKVAKWIPYQASLQWLSYHICGGVIISDTIVLTAAHCMFEENRNQYKIRVGTRLLERRGQVRVVVDFLSHPKFSVEDLSGDFDIAILLLNKPLFINGRVQAVKLPNANETPISGTKGFISGWGLENEEHENLSDKLKIAVVVIQNETICNMHLTTSPKALFCAKSPKGKVDACTADSGGPLIVQEKLIGIISSGEGCARENKTGIYTDIPYIRPWIDETIRVLQKQLKIL